MRYETAPHADIPLPFFGIFLIMMERFLTYLLPGIELRRGGCTAAHPAAYGVLTGAGQGAHTHTFRPHAPPHHTLARHAPYMQGFFVFCFLFYFPSFDSTQNTAGVPQERTPLQIVCAPAPVRIRRPSSKSAALKASNPSTAAASHSRSPVLPPSLAVPRT